MPDVPAVHVVEVDEEEAEPDPGGDVALQHDDTEEETAEHSAQLGAAEKPATERGEGSLRVCTNLGRVKRKLYLANTIRVIFII